MRQTIPAEEIIVVDSHSTDATVSAVKAYNKKMPLKVVTAKQRGLAAARNEGARATSGDLLLFIDADVRLPSNLIATLHKQIAERGLEIGGFPQRMTEGSLGLRFGARLMSGYEKVMSYTKVPIFFSCFFATKKVHERINGFNIKAWRMEDYDYAYRAKKTGAKFGIIKGVHFIASPRRFEDKAATSIWQAFYAELYRYTHGMEVTKPLFHYEMGGDEKSSKKTSEQ